MAYLPRFTKEAVENIKELPKNVKNQLRKQIEQIVCVNPKECAEELIGLLAGFHSFHCQEYRVIYRIYDEVNVVAIVGVGKKNSDHYAEIYKRLEQMASAGKLADSLLRNLQLLSRQKSSPRDL